MPEEFVPQEGTDQPIVPETEQQPPVLEADQAQPDEAEASASPHTEVPAFPAGTFISPDVQTEAGADGPGQPSAPTVPDTLVEDVDKAHDMALASNEDRTKAAENRAATHEREDAWMAAEFEQKKGEPEPPAWNLKARKERKESLSSLLGSANEARHQASERETELYGYARNDFEGDEMGLGHPYFAEDRAVAYDKRAEALEEWAAILHDQPVSEAFKAAHPDVEITPQSLYNFERDIQKQAAEIGRFEQQAKASTMQIELQKKHGGWYRDTAEFTDLLDVVDESLLDDYATKFNDMEAAVKAYNATIQNIYEVAKIQPQRNRVALMRSFIDDIRSGRAAE